MKKKAVEEEYTFGSDNYSIEIRGNTVTKFVLSDTGWHWKFDESGVYLFLARIGSAQAEVTEGFVRDLESDPGVSAILDATVQKHLEDNEALKSLGWFLFGDDRMFYLGGYQKIIVSELMSQMETQEDLAWFLEIPQGQIDNDTLQYAVELAPHMVNHDLPGYWIRNKSLDLVDKFKGEIDFSGWKSFMFSVTRVQQDADTKKEVVAIIVKGIYDDGLFDYDKFKKKVLEHMKKRGNEGYTFDMSDFYAIDLWKGRVDNLHLFGVRYLSDSTDATGIYGFLHIIAGLSGARLNTFTREVTANPQVSDALNRAVVEYQSTPEALEALGNSFLGSRAEDIKGRFEKWVADMVTQVVTDRKKLAKFLAVAPNIIPKSLVEPSLNALYDHMTMTDEWVDKLRIDVVDTFKRRLDFSGWKEFMDSVSRITDDHSILIYLRNYIYKDIWNGTIFDVDGFRNEVTEYLLKLSEEG